MAKVYTAGGEDGAYLPPEALKADILRMLVAFREGEGSALLALLRDIAWRG